jgi:putative ABC transport system permease protein
MLDDLWYRFRALFLRAAVETEMDEELRFHFEQQVNKYVRSGLTPSEARRRARLDFGGFDRVKEECREARGVVFFETLFQDVRYGLRLLFKSPGFAAVAVLTLALGIGANTAIFSVVHAVLLKPLPYPKANRLAMIWTGLGNETRTPATGTEVFEIRERSRLFEQIGGIWVTNGTLIGDGEPEQIKLARVTANFLPLLCTRPEVGRFFTPDEQQTGPSTVAVISYGLWNRRYGANPKLIGQSVRAVGGSVTVIGVLPQDFSLMFPEDSSIPSNVDLFIPLPSDLRKTGSAGFIRMIGRMVADTNIVQAQTEADGIAADLRRLDKDFSEQNLRLRVLSLQDDNVRSIRPALLVLFGAVGLVLLIACANAANLLLARASRREREITLRAALGAARGRLIRQLLTESILLGWLGGGAAVAVGWAVLKGLLGLRPQSLARLVSIRLDPEVLGFTLAVAILTGVLVGLAPAFGATRIDLLEGLKEGGRTLTFGHGRSRNILIASELALSFALLIGTGLMLRTFLNTLNVNPGFSADSVLSFQVSDMNYNFLHPLQQNLSALPEVQSASAVSHLPLDDSYPNWYSYYWPEGTPPDQQNTLMADHRSILPGYFNTIGATLLEGRDFTDSDDASHPPVVIIDDGLAQQTWPGQDPIGKKLSVEDSPKGPYAFEREWAAVIGVVKHVQYHSLTVSVRPQIYFPFPLAPRPMFVVVRTSRPPAGLATAARQEVARLNKNAAVSKVAVLSEYVTQARSQTRFVTFLSGGLAGLALLLACIGVYSVTSYTVSQRTGEIGVRMTLGAQPLGILKMVLRQGIPPIAWGLAAGFAVSLALTPLLRGLLFGVSLVDPLTFAAVFILLACMSVFACFIPARRATKVDPIVALRYE